MASSASKHDPLKDHQEESSLELEQVEQELGTEETASPEESAINIDTESALEANGDEIAVDDELEQDMTDFDKAADAILEDRKHKNRESTSEKSKRAATERVEKGQKAEPVATKILDPLRLRGKKYRKAVELVDRTRVYSLEEAVELVKKTSYASFDSAVEFHAKVKTEGVRGTVSLPHGTGKSKKVAIADDDTLEAIASGKFEFDVLIATPAQMPKLAKFAKVLGPKGLMPSPKAGTVTEDVERVKNEIGGGRIEYRLDKTGVLHASIGRTSFTNEQLVENFRALEAVIINSKIQSISIASTMGPGVKVKLTV